MDEIIDALREHSQVLPVPLELPDEDILVEVEELLFIALGADFREFLLSVSDVVYGSIEPVTAADPNMHTYLPEVAAKAWDEGLPRDLLPICEIATGYYFIDEESVIGLWENQQRTEDRWETIWDWCRDVWLDGLV